MLDIEVVNLSLQSQFALAYKRVDNTQFLSLTLIQMA